MGRVKEAVLASLARPIVSSVSAGILGAPHSQSRQCWHPWRTPLSVPSVRYGLRLRLIFFLIYTRYLHQNIYTRINIHTRQLCESSTCYRSYGF